MYGGTVGEASCIELLGSEGSCCGADSGTTSSKLISNHIASDTSWIERIVHLHPFYEWIHLVDGHSDSIEYCNISEDIRHY